MSRFMISIISTTAFLLCVTVAVEPFAPPSVVLLSRHLVASEPFSDPVLREEVTAAGTATEALPKEFIPVDSNALDSRTKSGYAVKSCRGCK